MYKSVITALLFVATIAGYGKAIDAEVKRSFSESFDVNANTQIVIRANDADVNISTWDQNRVEVQVTLVVHGKDESDMERFIEAAQPSFSSSPTNVTLSNEVCFRKMITTNNTTKVWLQEGGPKIQIDDYHFTMTVKMPAGNPADIKTKYSKVQLPSLTGEVVLTSLDCDVSGGNLTGSGRAKFTYGNANMGNLTGLGQLELYEMDFACGNLGDVDLNARYSDLRMGSAGKVDLMLYECDAQFGQVEALDGKISYGDLNLKNGKSLDLEVFEGDVRGEIFESVELEAKYSKFDFKTVAMLETQDFENRYEVETVGNLEADGKYSRYEIERLTGKLEMDGFENKLEVDLVDAKVSSLRVKGKYLDVELEVSPKLHYDLDVSLQYTNFMYPRELFGEDVGGKDRIEKLMKSNQSGTATVTFTFDCFEGSIELAKS